MKKVLIYNVRHVYIFIVDNFNIPFCSFVMFVNKK